MKRFKLFKTAFITKSPYLEHVEADEVSDGYHTFSELYDHRIALFAALCNNLAPLWNDPDDREVAIWKSRLHSDGTMFEGGYFIAGIQTGNGQITYHMKLKWWDRFRIPELPHGIQYDGHTPNDCIERLLSL